MRIAWVSPYLHTPENSGGRIRIANLARAFPNDELHLYARFAEDDPDPGTVRPETFLPWRSIHGVRARWPRWPKPFTPRVALSFPPEVLNRLCDDDAREPFDAVVIDHCYGAHWVKPLRRAALILSEQNIESEYFKRAVRARPRHALGSLLDFLRWRRFEARIWRSVDSVVVVSERDREQVRRVRPDTGCVVPNGIALARYRFIPPSGRHGNAILFLGMLSYKPNQEAAIVLAERVLPRVRSRIPDATLTLAGRDPLNAVRRLASDHVRVTGTIPDVAPLFDEHAAFAVPLSFGGGSSLKVLEALATGLPLVASPFAVRGYDLAAEREYLSGRNPAELADQLCRVLERRAEFDALAARGRLIADAYDWGTLGRRFADVVRASVAARLGGRPA
jgi:polysaccharide biosynthesis protein PslH